jgi:hypothetical protein
MSIVHQLEGCQAQVQELKGRTRPDSDEETVVARNLVLMHPQSDQVWVIPFPIQMADDIGGQMQGEAPKKHIEVPSGAAIPPALSRNGGSG